MEYYRSEGVSIDTLVIGPDPYSPKTLVSLIDTPTAVTPLYRYRMNREYSSNKILRLTISYRGNNHCPNLPRRSPPHKEHATCEMIDVSFQEEVAICHSVTDMKYGFPKNCQIRRGCCSFRKHLSQLLKCCLYATWAADSRLHHSSFLIEL
jgi:hypothetical protein